MKLSRTLATACAAVLLPLATSAYAGPKGVGLYPSVKDPTPAKTAEAARAELAAMKADGTLQRYQSLRTPPPLALRTKPQATAEAPRPMQTTQDFRAVYIGG